MWSFLENALNHADYGVVVAVVLAEIAAVQLQIAWLVVEAVRTRNRARRVRRFSAELGEALLDVLSSPDPELHRTWVRRASRYSLAVIREQIEPLLILLSGDARDALIALYREVGLLAADIAMSRSFLSSRRIRGLRRLSLVAGPSEVPALLERRNDRHIIRLIAVQILVRVGTPEQVVSMLAHMRLPSRLLEQPVADTLSAASIEIMQLLTERFQEIEDPGLRRVVLAAAAHSAPMNCMLLLPAAAADQDRELRIGACLAAGVLQMPNLAPIVIAALNDPLPEVRAQAAKALGRFRMDAVIEPLAHALGDRAFWVRQNAAAALGSLGPAGHRKLEEIVVGATDRFAVDTARQELRRRELLSSVGVLAS